MRRIAILLVLSCSLCGSTVADSHDTWPANAVAGDSFPASGPESAAYMKETWPKARLLVWARPGRNGTGRADDWLEDGQPATDPPDENTDLLIPGVETSDDRPPRRWDLGERITCRHLTVTANANVFVHTLKFTGNVWIQGRCMLISCNAVGSNDSFLRNDGPLKLVVSPAGGDDRGGSVALYDIFADPAEKANLAADRAEDVQQMCKALGEWRKSVQASYDGKDFAKPQ